MEMIMDKQSFLQMIEYLKGRQVYIQTHNFPDPDAIGSAFGLAGILRHYGITSTLCYVGQIDRVNTKKMTELCQIRMLSEEELEKTIQPEDPIICVDSQKGGGNIKDLPGEEIACIDHHPLIEREGYRYLDVRKTGSCATMIAEYYQELSIVPETAVATALLYGLKMDTLHFTRGVTEADIRMFAFLFPLASQEILTELTSNTMEFQDLRAYGSAIENIFVYDRVGFAGIPFSCQDAQIAVVSDFILSLENVDVSVIYADRKDGIKFSVRSETPSIDAGKLTAEALRGLGSGGGHSFMAGGIIFRQNVETLGVDPDTTIRELFYHALKKAGVTDGT